MRIGAVIAAALSVAGCATKETVQFQPSTEQQSLVRDGVPAIVSRRANSIVLVRPAAREFRSGARPVFVVGIYNLGKTPINFRVATVEATQIVNQQATALKVITYEQLVSEEQTRQVFAAIGTGLAAGANAVAASNAGYYQSNTTVYGPNGTYQARTVGYSPTAAYIAQANASAQNEAMIQSTIERGQENLANLERGVIKDNTLLPGEWYGGQLHLQPLASGGSNALKQYQVTILVGPDRHDVSIAQGPIQ
jgi:hypothetical protein